ncbi:hypothetical protein FWK35_00008738, partial [Aphis craccivora]
NNTKYCSNTIYLNKIEKKKRYPNCIIERNFDVAIVLNHLTQLIYSINYYYFIIYYSIAQIKTLGTSQIKFSNYDTN